MNFILDFDSTIVRVESLDELARMVLAGDPDGEAKAAQIANITAAGMEGRIGFADSLRQRMALVSPRRNQVEALIDSLHEAVDNSFVREADWLAKRSNAVWVVSGGFDDWIVPVVERLGLRADHVLANRLIWDTDGVARGYETGRPLAQDDGKVLAVRSLSLDGGVVMVGDGMTDYEVRRAGLADTFVAYVAHADRPAVLAVADEIADNPF
jgi:D-3-phosphoglycerate dehydrogenase